MLTGRALLPQALVAAAYTAPRATVESVRIVSQQAESYHGWPTITLRKNGPIDDRDARVRETPAGALLVTSILRWLTRPCLTARRVARRKAGAVAGRESPRLRCAVRSFTRHVDAAIGRWRNDGTNTCTS